MFGLLPTHPFPFIPGKAYSGNSLRITMVGRGRELFLRHSGGLRSFWRGVCFSDNRWLEVGVQ